MLGESLSSEEHIDVRGIKMMVGTQKVRRLRCGQSTASCTVSAVVDSSGIVPGGLLFLSRSLCVLGTTETVKD